MVFFSLTPKKREPLATVTTVKPLSQGRVPISLKCGTCWIFIDGFIAHLYSWVDVIVELDGLQQQQQQQHTPESQGEIENNMKLGRHFGEFTVKVIVAVFDLLLPQTIRKHVILADCGPIEPSATKTWQVSIVWKISSKLDFCLSACVSTCFFKLFSQLSIA